MQEIEENEPLADEDPHTVEGELKKYFEASLKVWDSSTDLSEQNPPDTDAVWGKCPTQGSKEWTVWVWRNNRAGTATYTGELAATDKGKCAQPAPKE